ncbi:hypothetical protein CYMTET_13234 [Cymbomonas tetramitiformis]|uniref:Uncharacterized protein n=1 Tax=Cymbomonas tetramitiformis TaxID=36881 RepID=A0AAE0GJ37_9CHLO|nr:hypothetical protein CYMTET_13234 [Cymbomonas tetramitiformis]
MSPSQSVSTPSAPVSVSAVEAALAKAAEEAAVAREAAAAELAAAAAKAAADREAAEAATALAAQSQSQSQQQQRHSKQNRTNFNGSLALNNMLMPDIKSLVWTRESSAFLYKCGFTGCFFVRDGDTPLERQMWEAHSLMGAVKTASENLVREALRRKELVHAYQIGSFFHNLHESVKCKFNGVKGRVTDWLTGWNKGDEQCCRAWLEVEKELLLKGASDVDRLLRSLKKVKVKTLETNSLTFVQAVREVPPLLHLGLDSSLILKHTRQLKFAFYLRALTVNEAPPTQAGADTVREVFPDTLLQSMACSYVFLMSSTAPLSTVLSRSQSDFFEWHPSDADDIVVVVQSESIPGRLLGLDALDFGQGEGHWIAKEWLRQLSRDTLVKLRIAYPDVHTSQSDGKVSVRWVCEVDVKRSDGTVFSLNHRMVELGLAYVSVPHAIGKSREEIWAFVVSLQNRARQRGIILRHSLLSAPWFQVFRSQVLSNGVEGHLQRAHLSEGEVHDFVLRAFSLKVVQHAIATGTLLTQIPDEEFPFSIWLTTSRVDTVATAGGNLNIPCVYHIPSACFQNCPSFWGSGAVPSYPVAIGYPWYKKAVGGGNYEKIVTGIVQAYEAQHLPWVVNPHVKGLNRFRMVLEEDLARLQVEAAGRKARKRSRSARAEEREEEEEEEDGE